MKTNENFKFEKENKVPYGTNCNRRHIRIIAGACQLASSVYASEFKMERKRSQFIKKFKRYRTAFTTNQINYLEYEFKKCCYLDMDRRKQIAIANNMPERAVKVWFQNRRMKEKNKFKYGLETDEERAELFSAYYNDLLNNAHEPSTNDPNRSSTTLTGSRTNTENNCVEIEVPAEISQSVVHKPSSSKEVLTSSPEMDFGALSLNVSKNNHTPSYVKPTAESCAYLTIKYRNKLIFTSQQPKMLNFEHTSSQLKIQDKSNDDNGFVQNVPLDLSCKKSQYNPDLPSTSKNVRFAPVLVGQPFVPTGNKIWNPINLLPIVPGPSSISTCTITSNDIAGSSNTCPEKEKLKKTCCGCDVEDKSKTETPQPPPAQFILAALPLQHYPGPNK